MKKNILVSVDRGETRVAVLEAKGSPDRGQAPQEGCPKQRMEGRRALRRAPRPPLDRRQHLQGQGRQRPARDGGGVRRHRPGAKRLPPRRRDRPARRQGRPQAGSRPGPPDRRADQARPGDHRPGRQGPAEDQGRAALDAALDRRPLPGLHAAGRRDRRLQAPARRRADPPSQADRQGRHRQGRRDRPHRRAGREEGGLRPRDLLPAPPRRGRAASGPRSPRSARWSSRRPTSRSASSATCSSRSSRARSSTTRSSTIGSPSSCSGRRRSSPSGSSSTRASRRCSRSGTSRRRSTRCSRRRVDLPSGGYLMIDYAEALTVIDINTGSFTGKGKGRLEDTITKVNVEAAEEVVRQLRHARHRRDHRHRLHRHGAGAKPRPGPEDAAQGAGRGPDQDLRGRGLAARPGRDDAPERHGRRPRDPHQALPDLRRRGRGQLRGDRGDLDRPQAPRAGRGAAEAGGAT